MIRFFKYATLFLYLCVSASSAGLLINNDEFGISIQIDSIDYKTQIYEGNKFSYRMNLPDLSLINGSTKYDVDELRLMFAVPDDAVPSLRIIDKADTTLNQSLNYRLINTYSEELKFHADLIEAGYQRNIREILVRIQPYTYNDSKLTILKNIKLRIDFGKQLKFDSKYILPEREYEFYEHLNNKEILPYLVSKSNQSKIYNKYDRMLESSWYDSSKTYIKITTKNDGIALFLMSDILNKVPDWTSKNNRYFHLLHNGVEIPLYFRNDNNSIADQSDTVYFFGRRAYGDTTWFDNYDDRSSFYLYYDASVDGKRLQNFPMVNSPAYEIKKIKMFSHIEKDRTYHRGFPQESSETAPGEGWWWNVLSPSKGWDSTLSDTLMILPADINDNSFFSFKFASCMWDPYHEYMPSHVLSLYLNNDKIAGGNYYYGRQDSINSKTENDKILSGLNIITFGTNSNYHKDTLIEPNQTGADYYTINYNAIPFAVDGVAAFSISNENTSSFLNITGFGTNLIFAIDTINNYFSQLAAENGVFIAVSANKESSSIIFNNDKKIYLNQAGVHVSYLGNSGLRIDKYFNSTGSDVIAYLKLIPSNSLFAITINSAQKATDDLKSYLVSIGARMIDRQNGNDSWVFCSVPGASVFEDYRINGRASAVGFTQNNNTDFYRAKLNVTENYSSDVYVTDEKNIEKADIMTVNNSFLKSNKNSSPVILIYNSRVKKSAIDFATFRSKANNVKIQCIDADDIYKEFNYGKVSPHAIKNFIKYAFNNWTAPKITHLIIWGDASWDVRKILKTSVFDDLIPTYGWPGSDYWYARLDDDYLPEIKVGRVPVKNDEDGNNYLDKLKAMDTVANNPWMKQFLMISGGQTAKEIDLFYGYAKYTYMEDNVANTDLCADTMVIKKEAPSNTSESQGAIIQKEINRGVEWIYYLGHGAARVFDLDGWQVEKLNNKGKYGFMSTLACNTAAFPEPSISSRNEDYLLYKDKGFIGTGGSSAVAFEIQALNLGLQMIQAQSQKNITIDTYVDALWYAKSKLIYSIEDKLTSDHYTYLGDPLVSLKIQRKPDFYFLPDEIKLTNQAGEDLITNKDSIRIVANLYNLGNRLYKTIKIRLLHEYRNEKDSLEKNIYGICYPTPISFLYNVIDKPGIHTFKLTIDPDNELGDTKLSNNSVTLSVEVFNQGVYPLEPLANWNINYKQPEFRIINPLERLNDFNYSFRIYDILDSISKPIFDSDNDGKLTISDDYINWKLNNDLKSNNDYRLIVNTEQKDNHAASPVLNIPFHTRTDNIIENADLAYSTEYTFNNYGTGKNLIIGKSNDTVFVKLNDLKLHYRISSLYGGSQKNPYRDAEITFNDKTYINVPPDIVGIKLVAISGDSTSVYAVRDYQTYQETSDAASANFFLRDTVKNGDYILLATNGESFRGFRHLKYVDPTNIGSLDSLHTILKRNYGSILADTLDEAVGAFSMIARKNSNSFITIESLNTQGDTALITGNIIKYFKDGNYITNEIGPAKQWKTITINSTKVPNDSIVASVLGFNTKTKNVDKIKSFNLLSHTRTEDISDVDTEVYPYIKLNLDLKRIGEIESPTLNDLQIHFNPVPELALSYDTKLLKDTLLRGDELSLNTKIKNLSHRTNSLLVSLQMKALSKSKIIDNIFIDVPAIERDNETELPIKETTDNYDSENVLQLFLNPDNKEKELYSFNNSRSYNLIVTEDNEPPRIVLKMDGREVSEGEYVSRVPYLEIELLDNSPLIINNPNLIGVGINRPFPSKHDTLFKSFGRQIPLKATLSFYSDTLDYGENYFRIIAYDNAGNSDTLTRRVNVSQNGIVKNMKAYPNPFNDAVNIDFDLGMQFNDAQLSCKIFNNVGQTVNEINQAAYIGKNNLKWNGYDALNAIAPSGLYTFVILIKSSTYFEPITGKLLFVR